MTKIAIIQGHPDFNRPHFCHALAQEYEAAALCAGHEVRVLDVANLAFPLLRSAEEFHQGALVPDVAAAQETLVWAQHLLLVYPLWYGMPPARMHAFLEQLFRPGVAVESVQGGFPTGKLHGRTARLVVTMAMPGWVYRWLYGALSAWVLRRHLLGLSGIKTVGMEFIGLCGAGLTEQAFSREMTPEQRAAWLARMAALGRRGA
jgi:putative NADPH-quinone reductase